MVEDNITIVRPQAGFQMDFLSSPADIVIGGGAAGSGKTYALLMEPLRHKDVKGFGSVIFRRTSPQIKNEGGLWDTSLNIFPHVGAVARESSLEWNFNENVKLKFSHLEYEKNVLDWQGSQIPLLGFDELTHFSKYMFFYMTSRNRSVCGVKPYVRATCNPDPDSWVAELIEWWIDQETGYPIPERSGVLRYFVVDGNSYIWGDTAKEVTEKAWHIIGHAVEKSGIDPSVFIKSITFIGGDIYGNKELLKSDPSYLGNLLMQDEETQSTLLKGNWKTVISDNDLFDHGAFAGMFNNVYAVNNEGRYITADIALEGADKFIILCWYGDEIMDIDIIPKSNGKEVIEAIEKMAKKHKVQTRFITYDADGVGGFAGGYLDGAIPFHNGATALPDPELQPGDKDHKKPENYFNVKTQCYYRMAKSVINGEIKVNEFVANKMYDDKMTVKQRFMLERRAIKKEKKSLEGKMKIIDKKEQKSKIGGQSPDLLDAFMMKKRFDFQVERVIEGGW